MTWGEVAQRKPKTTQKGTLATPMSDIYIDLRFPIRGVYQDIWSFYLGSAT